MKHLRRRVFSRPKEYLKAPLLRFSVLLVFCLIFLQACSINIENILPSLPRVSQEPAQAVTATNASILTQVPTNTASPTPSVVPTDTPVPPPTDTPIPEATDTPLATDTPVAQPTVVFAVIGDYGSGQGQEGDVANEVADWKPDLIITVGDNNYPVGGADTIDEYIGKYYHNFIYPYTGKFGDGADENRFFPSLGNHDVMTENGKPYYDYFTLPGNERYYDFVWGPVHFFAINSMETEPDGVISTSVQAEWLKNGLEASTSPWNIVYFHYPPYSSGLHGSTDYMRWPFKDWGADVVLSGHDHSYERLEVDGLTYIINGLGGGGIYDFVNTLDSSKMRYNNDWGAIRGEATDHNLKLEFITRTGEVIDTFEMEK